MNQQRLIWKKVIQLPVEGGIFECIADHAHTCGYIRKISLEANGIIIFTKPEAEFAPKQKLWLPKPQPVGMWSYTFSSDKILPTAAPPYLLEDGSVTFYSEQVGIHNIYPKGINNEALKRALSWR